MMDLIPELAAVTDKLKQSGRFRELREITTLPGGRAELDGRVLLNFSGNDYLGIAGDDRLRREFYASIGDPASPEFGFSAASSRLLTGNHPAYTELERSLEELYPGKSALMFNSGYHANVGVLPALAGKSDLILADKLDHASLIDGIRLSGADFRRYAHLDYEMLERMLRDLRGQYRRCFLVTESVFSMDGDVADLKVIAGLRDRYDAALLVDEAHSVGCRGPRGAGLSAELGILDKVDILIGTFGKAFGATGAYAIVSAEMKSFLINHMRTLIFTTGLPPVVVRWNHFALQKAMGMEERRKNLALLSERLHTILTEHGFAHNSGSQIAPMIIGSDLDTVAVAERLRRNGMLVFPIRPPTVPAGTSRLRFSLTAAMSDGDLTQLEKSL